MYYAQRVPYITITVSDTEYDLAVAKSLDNGINLQTFLRFCSIEKIINTILNKYRHIDKMKGDAKQVNIRLKQESKNNIKSIFENKNISITGYYRFCIFDDDAFNIILRSYRKFKIYEPKERIIWALPFRDRVMHQWYVEEFIKPIFLPKFISDT